MQNRYLNLISCVLMAGLLSACGSRDKEPNLLNIRQTSQGPDEFSVVPAKPLTEPTNFKDLPVPTPGGSNITDPTPEADAITALGGKPGALARPADGGIVNYASRFGREGAIRSELAAEDLEFRRAHDGRLLEKLFSVNVYFKAYAGMALDQYRELDRWRRKGLRTPAAPPPPQK
ncbi:MAG: DUF3035 domain-containing protein [Deltaproteobacteria bacterium]